MSNEQPMPECQHGLSEISVEVRTNFGVVTVPGLAHEACPGLAVTMNPFGVFSVTQIRSGLKLCNIYQRASSALLAMSWWALIANAENKSWKEMGPAEASVMISKASDKPVPFDGCTSTTKGVTRKMTVGEWFQHQRIPMHDEFPWEETDPFETAIDNFERIEVPV
ncbi:MAG TPA: hypothetical protein VFN01_00550 [Marinobacter sp.]|uniref:hypothetical protein n=1 Tax=Marinobacter sp. TaxID=50741 RepID=UPI002D805B85|nr:hypothetical protein [Marinobacter sp.]HET8799647.1 hypothetical protein [Marinobacter sp.]